jgi:hypothetical protein
MKRRELLDSLSRVAADRRRRCEVPAANEYERRC